MKKVLVVDDDKDIVQAIEAILSMENYSVIHSYTGRESIKLALQEHPDIILLDYMLPDINGKEVIMSLRQKHDLSETSIYLISAAHGIEGIVKELPIQGLLKKPFELENLLHLVSTSQ